MYHNLDHDSAHTSAADTPYEKRQTPAVSAKAGSDQNHAVDSFDIDIHTCSSTDCTGLIPALPRDEFERESYEEMYPYVTMKASDNNL